MSKLVKMLVCVSMCAAIAYSVPLFQENWDTGVINAADWLVTDTGGVNVELTDPLSNGDYALTLWGAADGPAVTWGDQIMSVASYARQENLAVSFKIWDGGTNDQLSFHGGWHNDNTNNKPYFTMEAAIGYIYVSLRAAGGEDGNHGISPVIPPDNKLSNAAMDPNTFQWSLAATTGKANALTVRITLGSTNGANWEWTRDGVTWYQERDTRGNVLASSNVNNYIGFAGFQGMNGTTMIDDVVVEVIPEPCTLALLGIGMLSLVRRKRS